jgi:phytanoyl-CoA hydroxylase
MAIIRNPFKRHKGIRWRYTQADLPWFDQPDALQVLEQRRKAESLSDEYYEALRKWVLEGYFVLDGTVNMSLVEGMVRDLNSIWSASEAIPELQICDVRETPDGTPQKMSHKELLRFSPEQREQMRVWSHWRVHELFRFSENCRAIHQHQEFIRITSLVFGRQGSPEYTINFAYGSRQNLHQDSAVFHLFPPNFLAGMWLACEDIVPEAGPLVYYPGSHREPFFPKFDNYPQTNLKTCDKATSAEYSEYINKLSEKYERKQFLAQKGQVLFWHGMLIHGGDAVIDPNRTRQSYVCHYVPPGGKQDEKIVGPFNW